MKAKTMFRLFFFRRLFGLNRNRRGHRLGRWLAFHGAVK